jgi:hypothetical protein
LQLQSLTGGREKKKNKKKTQPNLVIAFPQIAVAKN